MSGEKRYRPSKQVSERVAKNAEVLAAAATARAAEQKRKREERLRLEEEQRDAELSRLRKLAIAKAAEEARERARTIEAEIRAIVTSCEVEFSAISIHLDKRFSHQLVKEALVLVDKVGSAKRDIAAVRESADVYKTVLASHLSAINDFQKAAAECNDVVLGVASERPVRDFMPDALRKLVERHKDAMSAIILREMGPIKSFELLQEIIESANQLMVSACKIEAEFENRNRLLEATISAIRSMGFYVADPKFVNPSEPFGPVALMATRGAERIVITVPLSGEIVSDWQGLPDGVCIHDFVSLLDKLKDNGFPCESSDPKLVVSPKLLVKGAKALPGKAPEQRSI
ncbi:MAG TPA: hypothetical protein DDZ51_22720 [Planctomycetaceae bacterium]|nr:hypothetical protein [Planctomycetaceae bacterium]